MLLEETARTCLGDKGDLVFVEPEETNETEDGLQEQRKKVRIASPRGPSTGDDSQEEREYERNIDEENEDD